MVQPTGTLRPLPYALKDSEDMESVVGSGGVSELSLDDWATEDADERVDIVLNISLNEYVALASTIDVGRDIAYGDNSIYLWWVWVRSLISMSICDAVTACINDPESGVMQAILEQITLTDGDSSIENGQSQGDLIIGTTANPTCSLDMLWGGIESVIERANQNNIDVLEQLEVSTNTFEWVAEVAGGLFGVELPVIQSLMDWAQFIQDSILENYEAEITTAYLEELQCDLFCLSKSNCELTPEILVDYFYDRLSSVLTIGSLLSDTAEFIITGSWSGTEIADVFFLSQFAFRAQLGRWFEDIAFGSIDLDMRLGFTNPSDNWILLCDECLTEIVVTFGGGGYSDYTIDNGSLDSGVGNPLPSAKYEVQGTTDIVTVTVNLPESSQVTEVAMDAIGSLNRNTIRMMVEDSLGEQTFVENTLFFLTGWNTYSVEGDWEDIVLVEFQSAVTAGATDQQWIDNLTVKYA